jgi:putative tryptophan/tyrosine transport system substrate-binding protein
VTILIRRREFVTLLGSATAAWPAMSIAQPAGEPPRVAVLMRVAEDDPNAQDDAQAFQRGLEKLGWTAGRNILIDYRWAAGSSARAQTMAKELVELKPNVLVAYGTAMLEAIRRATKTIPIVFTMVSDPVGQGFVVSLSRPGGNATGFTSFEFSTGGKWLDLIKEASPGVKRAGVIFNPVTAPYATSYLHSIESAAVPFAVDVTGAPVQNDADIERVITALGQDPGGSLIVVPDTFTDVHAGSIISLAARYRLPAVYPYTQFAKAGGLMTFGPDPAQMFGRAADYVDRILRGASPADLPVQEPNKYELIVNLKAAKAIDLALPPTLIARADRVIE